MEETLEKIEGFQKSLQNRFNKATHEPSLKAFGFWLKRWERKVYSYLQINVSLEEAEGFKSAGQLTISMGSVGGEPYEFRQTRSQDAFLDSLIEEIRENPFDYPLLGYSPLQRTWPSQVTQPKTKKPKAKAKSKKVFIVHGHDSVNVLELKRMLTGTLGVETKVLKYEPGGSRTIIEKLEEVGEECGFAFVVYTPDDTVKKGKRQYRQARPNVFIEIGWFFAKISRKNVSLLIQKGATTPSDLNGINYHEFDKSVVECFEGIQKELKKVGIIK